MKTLIARKGVFLREILMLSVIFVMPSFLHAQEITLTQSNTEILNSTTRLYKIFGEDADYFYLIRFTGSQYRISKLDQNLNKVHEEPVKLFKGLVTYTLEAIYHFYNDIYIFVSQTRFNNITLYYQKIDKETLLPLTELIEITTVKNVKGSWADFHFALSRNETRLMVAARTKLVWSGAQFNEFFVFGENLDLIWKRNDSFQFQGQGPRDNYYLVDETGNVSILSLLKRESIMSLFRDIKNLYSIYRYTVNGSVFYTYPVSLNDRYIRGINIIGNNNGELICAGLYSETFRTGVKGTFFFKIDANSGRIYDQNLNPFDEAVLSDLEKMKEPLIGDEEVINYNITDMVLRQGDKMIIIAEQVFHQTYDTYNNLIITSYDLTGQVYWTRVIQKKQSFNYNSISYLNVDLVDYRKLIMQSGYFDPNINNYCSYALMAPVDKTGIVLFYNDHVANMNNPESNKPFSQPRKSYLLSVAIDEYGNISRKPVVQWRKRALFPEPIRYYDTLSDTLVIPAFRNRMVGFYKISADINP